MTVHIDRCQCLSSFLNSILKGIILPVRLQGHSFVLYFYNLGDFFELVERKQEKTVFQCITLHSVHHIINENPMKPSH